MTFFIWFIGFVIFFIYDHLIGLELETDDFSYMILAAFWYITIPVLFLKWLKNPSYKKLKK